MFIGEVANFSAYAFAPAVLVTPLGALSVIVRCGRASAPRVPLRVMAHCGGGTSAVLAAMVLDERLDVLGKTGCALSLLGSTVIVLNAPDEEAVASMEEILIIMTSNTTFAVYTLVVVVVCLLLVYGLDADAGQRNVFVYVAVCSLVGSLSVMFVKALSVGLKLTFEGNDQTRSGTFWMFSLLVGICIAVQMNYLNKALDTFNTAVVSPIYYVLFTTFTIMASSILFLNGWGEFGTAGLITVCCGFATIVIGVGLLHMPGLAAAPPAGAGGQPAALGRRGRWSSSDVYASDGGGGLELGLLATAGGGARMVTLTPRQETAAGRPLT